MRSAVLKEFEDTTGLNGEEASLAYADYGYDAVTTFGITI